MSAVLLEQIPVSQIDPSPFQHRRYFDDGALQELARSIKDDGLIQPITVRRTGDRFELIAGERRWRASSQYAGLQEITARVLDCDDLQARRLCAVENLQRADLTAIEEVQALAELIDSELLIEFGDEYTTLSKAQEPKWRVRSLLMAIKADEANGTSKVMHKFVHKTDSVFSSLPKPKTRESFASHDLPLLFTADEVQRFAMQHRLNKSQTKAVEKLARSGDVRIKEALSDDTGQTFVSLMKSETLTDDVEDVRDFSAQDISRVAARNRIEQRHQNYTQRTVEDSRAMPARIHLADALDWLQGAEPFDLLLTDPPYSTDVADIREFAKWLPAALDKLKPTGRAFVFVGAYPTELQAYMDLAMPEQMLVWTYRNTLGPSPKHDYKLNWQAILYYRKPEAPPLDCPVMVEQFSVQDINAPDGRLGDRYHSWQKPMEIGERFIRHSTKPGDVVADPFACTGTFLLAASKLGRQGVGCEIDPSHLEIAVSRGCARG